MVDGNASVGLVCPRQLGIKHPHQTVVNLNAYFYSFKPE